MKIQQYSVNQHPIQTLISWIESGEIAIPEIQRPFVWSATQVRDLLDSLYNGYPIGYLIAWRNPSVRLKDGSISAGKRILIDGQQRVTALIAALLGNSVIDKEYKRVNIKIAFHPIDRTFEVANPAIAKDRAWLSDISSVFSQEFKLLAGVDKYCAVNGIDNGQKEDVYNAIDELRSIVNNSVGLIELNADLDIETVTEIFIRINSAGTVLSQADFAMSKIAADESYGGNNLRKAIDYFCHLAVKPDFYHQLRELDIDFTKSNYFQKMTWLKNENDDLYDPTYTDMLRVAFTSEFKRGKLEDLVALLSGRNFETRNYESQIAEESFAKLSRGVISFMNESNFKRFVMILRSAGFVEPHLIRSKNALNFAYILYLTLRDLKTPSSRIEKIVKKWFVLSLLTSRYTGSPESRFDWDIKQFSKEDPEKYLESVINAELSDAFWEFGLPQQLNSSVATNPSFKVFLAAQIAGLDKGFLSKDITVFDLITHKGDVHHIFPKSFLKKKGLKRGSYNQVANYVIAQSEINIAIGDKPPARYVSEVFQQCETGDCKYGGIVNRGDLDLNLKSHCFPMDLSLLEFENYEAFLEQRRSLMSHRVKEYYSAL